LGRAFRLAMTPNGDLGVSNVWRFRFHDLAGENRGVPRRKYLAETRILDARIRPVYDRFSASIGNPGSTVPRLYEVCMMGRGIKLNQ
jgi:hypothetical protein